MPRKISPRLNAKSGIILLNPALNPEGYTFEDYFHDPRVVLTIQARFREYVPTVLSRTCDFEAALPQQWDFYLDNQNIGDGAYFGGRLIFERGQVPSVAPAYGFDEVDEFLRRDFSKPEQNPWLRDRMAFHARLVKEAEGFTYLGRKGRVAPFLMGFDGPVTAVSTLFGADGMALLGAEPEKARALLEKITSDVMIRNRFLADRHEGWKKCEYGWLADDSIQLLSTEMYRELVLPVHARWYDWVSEKPAAAGGRSIHLCGDVGRHLPTIHRELGVTIIDTGFPVDHGWLRRTLGAEVEISGGPAVMFLRERTPEECARETLRILRSGIMEGGRFILQEANNLPPCCPLENLEAVYQTCLEFGCYN